MARCFKEKRARNRTGSGVSSEQSDSRRALIVGSTRSAIGAILNEACDNQVNGEERREGDREDNEIEGDFGEAGYDEPDDTQDNCEQENEAGDDDVGASDVLVEEGEGDENESGREGEL